jgi:long-chain fatty acid transport protein
VIPGGGGASVDVAFVELDAPYSQGYGWNAALWCQATDRTQVGFAYRSRVSVDVDGTADFTLLPTGNPIVDAAVAASLVDQDVSSTLRFPAIWSLGVAWSPTQRWTFEADFNWTEWSFFEDLPVTFENPTLSSRVVENYQDSYQVRLGAEHRLPGWTYRFGYYYDRAAAPVESVTPLLPDADRNGIAVGLGLPLGDRLSVDLYDCGLFVRRRTTDGRERENFNGIYKGFVNLAGAALSWRF